MNLKKILKKILYLCPSRYIDKFYLIYNRIFYSELTEKKMTFGSSNEDKTFYIIRYNIQSKREKILGKFFLSRFQSIHLMRYIKVRMLFYLDLMHLMKHILIFVKNLLIKKICKKYII